MSARSAGAARRYARALLDVAGEEAEALRGALERAAALLATQRELAAALAHPAVSAEKKRALVGAVWKAEPELLRRLLGLLAERERLPLLPDVARLFTQMWNARRGVVAAEAVTAQPLSGPQRQALLEALRQQTGREVELAESVEASVLGGVLVRMEGRVYDGSVRGRLEALRESLVGRGGGA